MLCLAVSHLLLAIGKPLRINLGVALAVGEKHLLNQGHQLSRTVDGNGWV